MLDRPTLPLNRPWTEAEDRLIREGRESGLSSSQIAHKLGKPKNAVIGRARRLGLPRLANNEFTHWTPEEDAVILKNNGAMSLRRIAAILGNRTESAVKNRRNKLVQAGVKIERRRPPMPIRKKAKAKSQTRYERPDLGDAPVSLAITCEWLEPDSCRFIAGDPKIDGTYCGHPVKPESSYCPYHHAVVWVRPERMRVKEPA